jgi:hypothetical protein
MRGTASQKERETVALLDSQRRRGVDDRANVLFEREDIGLLLLGLDALALLGVMAFEHSGSA